MADRDGLFAGDDPFDIARRWLSEAERTEPNGTFAVRYDCVWLQGFEPAWRALLPQ